MNWRGLSPSPATAPPGTPQRLDCCNNGICPLRHPSNHPINSKLVFVLVSNGRVISPDFKKLRPRVHTGLPFAFLTSVCLQPKTLTLYIRVISSVYRDFDIVAVKLSAPQSRRVLEQLPSIYTFYHSSPTVRLTPHGETNESTKPTYQCGIAHLPAHGPSSSIRSWIIAFIFCSQQ